MKKNGTDITTYQRKPQIWFGTESAPFPYDLTWKYPLQVCLDRDLLFFRREGGIKVLFNGTDAGTDPITVQNGDELQVEDFRITFFKDRLEVLAESGSFQTTLGLEQGGEWFLEGFPV